MGAVGPGASDLSAVRMVLLGNRATLALDFCRIGAKCQVSSKCLPHLIRHKRESRKESRNSSVVVSRATTVLAAIRPAGMWTSLKYPPDQRLLSPAVSFFPDPLFTTKLADSFLYSDSPARIVGFPCFTTSVYWEFEPASLSAVKRMSKSGPR